MSNQDTNESSIRGETLLITGQATTEAGREAWLDAITPIDPANVNLLLIAVDEPPDEWLTSWRQRVGAPPANQQVLTVGQRVRSGTDQRFAGSGRDALDGHIVCGPELDLDSPAEPVSVGTLHRVGLAISETLSGWDESDNRTVICGGSLTGLLSGVGLQRLFGFLHIYLHQLRNAGARVYFHVDPDVLDPLEQASLEELFDRVLAEHPNRGRSDDAGLDRDTVFELLSATYRRHMLRVLANSKGAITVDDLTRRIVAQDGQPPRAEPPSDSIEQVEIQLRAAHLPKLDAHDVVSYDHDAGTVSVGRNAGLLVPHLDRLFE